MAGGSQITKVSPGQIIDKETYDLTMQQIKEKHNRVSSQPTPQSVIKKNPSGFKYVKDDYMRGRAIEDYGFYNFEQVSLEIIHSTYPQQVSGDQYFPVQTPEWLVFTGNLTFLDEGIPRIFTGVGASRVQYRRESPHTPNNIIDLDKQIKSARTQALKDAINRAMNIADDVYQKDMQSGGPPQPQPQQQQSSGGGNGKTTGNTKEALDKAIDAAGRCVTHAALNQVWKQHPQFHAVDSFKKKCAEIKANIDAAKANEKAEVTPQNPPPPSSDEPLEDDDLPF